MAERNTIMKNVKKIISAMMSGAMALTICAGTALNVSAVDVHEERESQYEPGYSEIVVNDTYDKAEVLPTYLLYKQSYYCHRGNFESNDLHIDRSDFYKFSVTKGEGNKGRFAIRLDNMASGNNFDLYLYDANLNCIASSTRTGNQKDIVKTPEITSTTDYYLEVRAKTVSSTQNSIYNIFVEDSIKTETKTAKLSPTTINSKPDQWSPNASKDMTSYVPKNAIVTKATVSAKKSSSSGGYNHVIRVRLNNKDDYETVAWTSGSATIPELVGKNCYGTWYAGFTASELPQLIAGKPTYLGIVALSNFELTVTYEYDVYPEYDLKYDL